MRPAWKVIQESYPCPRCGAQPGNPCKTAHGWKSEIPHAARTRQAGEHRCSKCGVHLEAHEGEPAGALCPKCALVRALEIERATKWTRKG